LQHHALMANKLKSSTLAFPARTSSDQMESSDWIKMLDSNVLHQASPILTRLMETNPFTLAGAVRSAIRCIGQAPKRTRWTDLAHRRPVFRARRTSLYSTCDQPDHGVKHAWPADAKNQSNESIISFFGITQLLQRWIVPSSTPCAIRRGAPAYADKRRRQLQTLPAQLLNALP